MHHDLQLRTSRHLDPALGNLFALFETERTALTGAAGNEGGIDAVTEQVSDLMFDGCQVERTIRLKRRVRGGDKSSLLWLFHNQIHSIRPERVCLRPPNPNGERGRRRGPTPSTSIARVRTSPPEWRFAMTTNNSMMVNPRPFGRSQKNCAPGWITLGIARAFSRSE